MTRKTVDWESVEREYRAGVRSLRDIASEFGCSEGAIRKKAKTEEWTRDLSAKINSRADELVRKAEVRKEVRNEATISEREQINASAQMLADKVINQREDVKRARSTVQRLWKLVDDELDKLNDMYLSAIGLPQQVKNVKLLADALRVLVELERKVLRLDDAEPPPDPLTKYTDDEIESRLADFFRKAGTAGAA